MLSYVNPFFSNSHDPYGGSAYVRCRPKPTSTSTQGTDGTIAQQTPDTDETLTVAGCSGPSRAATPIAVTNATKAPTLSRNLYQEGMQHKYFVQSPVPGVGAYKFHSGSIEFCMLDLTNPAARTWMKAILREQMLRDTGVSGWMADFGEYLPFDAVLHDGSSGAEYHNKYPEEWARLNYEAVQEYQHECESFKYEEESRKESADESIVTPSNTDTEHLLPARQRRSVPLISQLLSFVFNFRLPFYSRRQSASHSHRHMADNTIGIKKNNAPPSTVTVSHFIETGAAEVDSSPRSDIMYFIRSAWLQSPKYVSAFWLGDQMVSWDRHDGIKTVLLGALSSGIGGHSLTHSDIGGYTMVIAIARSITFVNNFHRRNNIKGCFSLLKIF